ncbi:uncharacterized protein LY89DRAFT_102022 [Mollisia scopiformis]|uniref:Uncharacterized protein n=1 Tax=Mollisia scopiformis TaxID=149040 RepID=A0A194X7A2_MOLSC|nr:uncharacterized protein LY89DRAFT_102022 [Mollisia scopiformis]KUJ16055.1 hypothetical protein LY89DRAFT_102022 [Mollisia scopiformis]
MTCYSPPKSPGQSGTAQDGNYTSCYPTQKVSMCCRTEGDSCSTNGLCMNTVGSTATYWRESCTDPTWTSPYCLNAFDVCPLDQSNNTPVTFCQGEGGYCCGANNPICCGTDSEIIIPQIQTPPAGSTYSGEGTNVGAIAGGLIGGICFISVITYIVWRFCIKSKRQMYESADWAEDFEEPAVDRYHRIVPPVPAWKMQAIQAEQTPHHYTSPSHRDPSHRARVYSTADGYSFSTRSGFAASSAMRDPSHRPKYDSTIDGKSVSARSALGTSLADQDPNHGPEASSTVEGKSAIDERSAIDGKSANDVKRVSFLEELPVDDI